MAHRIGANRTFYRAHAPRKFGSDLVRRRGLLTGTPYGVNHGGPGLRRKLGGGLRTVVPLGDARRRIAGARKENVSWMDG